MDKLLHRKQWTNTTNPGSGATGKCNSRRPCIRKDPKSKSPSHKQNLWTSTHKRHIIYDLHSSRFYHEKRTPGACWAVKWTRPRADWKAMAQIQLVFLPAFQIRPGRSHSTDWYDFARGSVATVKTLAPDLTSCPQSASQMTSLVYCIITSYWPLYSSKTAGILGIILLTTTLFIGGNTDGFT